MLYKARVLYERLLEGRRYGGKRVNSSLKAAKRGGDLLVRLAGRRRALLARSKLVRLRSELTTEGRTTSSGSARIVVLLNKVSLLIGSATATGVVGVLSDINGLRSALIDLAERATYR